MVTNSLPQSHYFIIFILQSHDFLQIILTARYTDLVRGTASARYYKCLWWGSDIGYKILWFCKNGFVLIITKCSFFFLWYADFLFIHFIKAVDAAFIWKHMHELTLNARFWDEIEFSGSFSVSIKVLILIRLLVDEPQTISLQTINS